MSELVPKEREINPFFHRLDHSVLDPKEIRDILEAGGNNAREKSRTLDRILILDYLRRKELSEKGQIESEKFERWQRAYDHLLAPLGLKAGQDPAFPKGNEDLHLLEGRLKAARQVGAPDIETLEKAAKFYREVRFLLES